MIMTNEELAAIVAQIRLDLYSAGSRFLGVVDANAIISNVDNDCRKGWFWRSRLTLNTSL